jgi:hypothetical protein
MSKSSIESNEDSDLGYRRIGEEEVARIEELLKECSSLRPASLPIAFPLSRKRRDSSFSNQGSTTVSSGQLWGTPRASQVIVNPEAVLIAEQSEPLKYEIDAPASSLAHAIRPVETLQKSQIEPLRTSLLIGGMQKTGRIREPLLSDATVKDDIRDQANEQGSPPVSLTVRLQRTELKHIKNIASEYYHRGDFNEARLRFEFLVRSYESFHKSKSYYRVRLSLAQITWFNGKYKSAEHMFKALEYEIKQAAEKDKDARLVGNIGKGITLSQWKQGRYIQAKNTIEGYCRIFEDTPQPLLLSTWALVLASSGAFRHAWQLSNKAIYLAEKIAKGYRGNRKELQDQGLEEDPTETSRHDNSEDTMTTCLYNHARISSEMGRFYDANSANKKVINDLQHRLGPKHIITLDAASLRAWLLVFENNPTDAGEEVLWTLRQMRERLGEQHPSTLQALQTLVLMYKSDGRYSDAQETAYYLVDRCQNSEDLGDTHPQTLKSRAILADVLLAIGAWDEAKTIALSIAKQEKSNSYFGVTLATILRTKGEWEPAHEKAIEILLLELQKYGDPREGEEHTISNAGENTKPSSDKLEQQRLCSSQASSTTQTHKEPLDFYDTHISSPMFIDETIEKKKLRNLLFSSDRLRHEIEKRIEQGSPDPFQGTEPFHVYPSLIRIIHCLALCEQVRDDADLNFVHDMLETLHGILSRKLSPTHRLTVDVTYDLAVNYRMRSYFSESLEHMEFVMDKRLQCLGADHPDYLVARHQHAVTLLCLSRWQEALEEQETILNVQGYLLGDDHADTVISRYTLSGIYHSLNRFQEADDLLHRVIDDQKRLYGAASEEAKDHPIVLRSRARRALIHLDMKKYESAEEEQKMVYDRRREKFNEHHSLTRNAKNDLAQIIQAARRFTEAKELYTDLETTTQSVIQAHPETRSHENAFLFLVQSNLASCLFDLAEESGDYTVAKQKQEELYSQMKKSLLAGQADERFVAVAFNLALTNKAMKNYLEAYDRLREATNTSCTLLGSEHPQTKELFATLQAWWEERMLLRNQQELNEAQLDNNSHTLTLNPSVLLPKPAVNSDLLTSHSSLLGM